MIKQAFLVLGTGAGAVASACALSPQPALAQAGGWTDYGGGIVLRRNEAITQALSGYSWVYVSTYNGGSGGGMAAQHRVVFCGAREIAIHSESSVSMGAGGAFGNSSSVEDDAGEYQVLEDKSGNTFLHMALQKNGNKFMHFRLDGVKIHAEQGLTFTRYQRVC